jgi:hypothetical protein
MEKAEIGVLMVSKTRALRPVVLGMEKLCTLSKFFIFA